MSSKIVVAIDLFCGAGGFSEGLRQACEKLAYELRHAAINHWDPAVQTHAANHPDAVQYNSKVQQLHPPDVVDDLVADDEEVAFVILIAGPECTHFSTARGDKPVNEQKRMSPWHVLDWLEKLDVDAFIVENVSEIVDWGPVEDGEPTRDGSVFHAWINALNQLGYAVDWTILNAADYGDPTSRERFFLIGRQHGSATFPKPTHDDVNPELPDRRTAAEIIDWSDLGSSIWTRDLTHPRVHTPPKDTTMQRIAEGIRRHCDARFEAFANALAELGRPEIRTLREQRVVPADYAAVVAEAVDEPFLVVPPACADRQSTTFLLGQQSGSVPRDVTERTAPTVAKAGSIAVASALTKPLVQPKNGYSRGIHSNRLYEPDRQPFHTVTADPRAKLVAPYLCPLYNGREAQRPPTRSVDRPLMTVVASKSPAALATPALQPFLDDYEGPAAPIDRPLGTLTARDRFALCVPELYPWGLDVRYRMLQPHELKQAQGFPADYEIVGNKEDRKEQIGNAVPVNLACTLCEHVLSAEDPDLASFGGGITGDAGEVPSYDEVVSDDD